MAKASMGTGAGPVDSRHQLSSWRGQGPGSPDTPWAVSSLPLASRLMAVSGKKLDSTQEATQASDALHRQMHLSGKKVNAVPLLLTKRK